MLCSLGSERIFRLPKLRCPVQGGASGGAVCVGPQADKLPHLRSAA